MATPQIDPCQYKAKSLQNSTKNNKINYLYVKYIFFCNPGRASRIHPETPTHTSNQNPTLNITKPHQNPKLPDHPFSKPPKYPPFYPPKYPPFWGYLVQLCTGNPKLNVAKRPPPGNTPFWRYRVFSLFSLHVEPSCGIFGVFGDLATHPLKRHEYPKYSAFQKPPVYELILRPCWGLPCTWGPEAILP